MPYFSRFLHRLTVCVLAFVGMFAVNSCLAAYTVNYLCGDGTGETPDDATDIQTGAGFVPAANTCTTPENYEFDGWSVSGTNDVVPANVSFTWEYPENKYFIAHYTKKTSCPAGQSWETYTCDLSDTTVGNLGGSEQTGFWGARAINGATGSDYTRPLNNYTLAKGEWISIMANDTIKGRAFCSNRAGNDWTLTYPDNSKDEWLTNDSELIAAGTGDYCWCKISNSLRYDNIESDWVFSGGQFSSSTCSSYCAIHCVIQFRAATPAPVSDFRLELYNAVTRAEQEKCEINANLYSITYSNLLDATWDENQLHPDSYITGEEITIGIPTREGYVFDGWCNDSTLTQNCTKRKIISASSSADLTFYAKWREVSCPAGYHIQQNPFSNMDGQASPTGWAAYNYASSAIVPTSGYVGPTDIPNNRWNMYFKNWNDPSHDIHMNGLLHGEVFCSASTGTNIDLTTTGDACWCHADGFTPKSGGLISFDGPWFKVYSGLPCNQECPAACMNKLHTQTQARLDFYNVSDCVLSVYSIEYDIPVDASFQVPENIPTSYTINDSSITLPTPSREGYTFAGWCDDAELTQNCTTEKVIPAGSTGDKTFYAKWAALPCGAGYESQTSPFNDTDYKASAVAYAYFDSVNGNPALVVFRGRDNEVNVDLDDSLETLPVGRYELFFKEGAEGVSFYGMLYGRAQCSTTLGYTGNWMFSGHGQSVPDTISETPGNYCWCQLDGFTPYTKSGTKWIPSGERSNFLTKWMSPGGTTCTPYSCAKFCVEKIGYQLPERQVMYGPGALPPCKIKTYTISYELDGGEWPIALVSKPETYNITSATINLPTPAEREGYTFDGWYDNNSFTGGAITQIPSGSYGKKTFYAKWKANVVEPVEPVEPDTEQEPTPVAEPDECALASCVVTIDFGNGQTIEETFINGDDLVMPVQEESAGLVFNGYCEGTPTCTEPQMRLTTEQIENGATVYPQYIPVSPETTAPSVEERTCPNDACEVVLNYDDSTESSGNIDLNSGSNPRSASALRRGGILNSSATGRSARTFNRGELLITPMLVKQGYTLAGYCIGETDTCSAPIAAVSNINLNTKSRVTITPKWNRSSSSPQPNPMDPDCTSHAWLHIGDTKACLSTTKFEKPVLGIKTKKGTYYLKASTDYALPMSKNTNRKLRVGNNGIIYNIHDGLVSE